MPDAAPAEARVFILDDEPEYAQPNIDALERRRFTVIQANSVDDAVDILTREGNLFKVLVLDMLMPGSSSNPARDDSANPIESGLKLHKQIRGRLGLIEVPIIFTSVVRDPKIRERIRDEETKYKNRVSFLTKPFLPMDLIERIKKVTAP